MLAVMGVVTRQHLPCPFELSICIGGLRLIRSPTGGMRETSSDDVAKMKSHLQSLQIPVDVILADNTDKINKKILSSNYTKIICYGVCDNAVCANPYIFHGGSSFAPFPLTLIPAFVKKGGKFIFHGEGSYISTMCVPTLGREVGGQWHMCGDFYRICRHSRNKTTLVDTSSLPRSYSMKVTMLSGVKPEHQLYSPRINTVCESNIPGFGGKLVSTKRTAVAAVPVGENGGIFAFFGDVNLEVSTIELVSAL